MINVTRFQFWSSIIVVVLAVLLAFPNALPRQVSDAIPRWLPHQQFNLGLDLRGGAYILLEADMAPVLRDHLADVRNQLRQAMRTGDNRVRYEDLRTLPRGVAFRVVDRAEIERAQDTARRIARDVGGSSGLLGGRSERYQVQVIDDRVTVTITDAGIAAIRDRIMEQAMEILRRRVDESGTKEVSLQRQGNERIILEIPGVDDPKKLEGIIGTTAKMTFHLTHPSILAPSESTPAPAGYRLVKGAKGELQRWHMITEDVELDGKHLVDAQPTFQDGRPIISFRMDTTGARIFCRITRENLKKPFAILLDNEVISAPVIQSEICGGQGIIQGSFTIESATELALLLRAGALPAPLQIAEVRIVGATLGADAIEAGIWTSILGVALVLVFLVASYGLFGAFAVISLLINLTILAAVMSLLQATLTLPGIAGIVLSLGMSVDANVLIYERMREELHAGRTTLSSIDAGFRRAFTAISDSNITSIITGLLMYMFGSGPVKGFGVTLAIGVGASFFTAVMLTRIQVVWWWRWRKPKKLPIAAPVAAAA